MHILFYYASGNLDQGRLCICLKSFCFYDWFFNYLVSCIRKSSTSDFSKASFFKLLNEFSNRDLAILILLQLIED